MGSTHSYVVSESSISENWIAFLTKPPTFLVVEDDDNYRELFLHCLSEFDCHVVAAQDGKQALGILKTMKLDLIFMNLKLPGISGIEVMRFAKQLHPKVPIIVITGYFNEPDAKEALQMGVVSVMEKPIDAASFMGLFDTFKIRVRTKASNVVPPAGIPPAT